MADLSKMSAEQLEALAAKKRRNREADVVDIAAGREEPAPRTWPTECTVHGATFHVVPELASDWDFQTMLSDFGEAAQAGETARANRLANELIAYMYEEPLDEIRATLRTLHPEDERPHVHDDDVAALIQGGIPKAR